MRNCSQQQGWCQWLLCPRKLRHQEELQLQREHLHLHLDPRPGRGKVNREIMKICWAQSEWWGIWSGLGKNKPVKTSYIYLEEAFFRCHAEIPPQFHIRSAIWRSMNPRGTSQKKEIPHQPPANLYVEMRHRWRHWLLLLNILPKKTDVMKCIYIYILEANPCQKVLIHVLNRSWQDQSVYCMGPQSAVEGFPPLRQLVGLLTATYLHHHEACCNSNGGCS